MLTVIQQVDPWGVATCPSNMNLLQRGPEYTNILYCDRCRWKVCISGFLLLDCDRCHSFATNRGPGTRSSASAYRFCNRDRSSFWQRQSPRRGSDCSSRPSLPLYFAWVEPPRTGVSFRRLRLLAETHRHLARVHVKSESIQGLVCSIWLRYLLNHAPEDFPRVLFPSPEIQPDGLILLIVRVVNRYSYHIAPPRKTSMTRSSRSVLVKWWFFNLQVACSAGAGKCHVYCFVTLLYINVTCFL